MHLKKRVSKDADRRLARLSGLMAHYHLVFDGTPRSLSELCMLAIVTMTYVWDSLPQSERLPMCSGR